MGLFIKIFQTVTAILLIVFVLLQVRGTGFGRSASSASFTRRGIEKLVFKLTFLMAGLFLVLSALSLFV